MVSPSEIEQLLLAHPDIIEAAVLGVPSPRRGTDDSDESGTKDLVPAAAVVAAKGRSPDEHFALELKQYVAGEEVLSAFNDRYFFVTLLTIKRIG
ncbi:hypothetical protein V5799_015349 [Amblyomma americanum]|uniref:AMP-binding enzyme C-terminal domain-containing protein n=1 Tax=Amblyomma americanum TaxID=6943 RepID=A0AAQ4E0E5_AMBAM